MEKHKAQFQTNIELRRSKELHDRLIFVDQDVAWIMGGSIKDAGKKATYLIPVATPIAVVKREIYADGIAPQTQSSLNSKQLSGWLF